MIELFCSIIPILPILILLTTIIMMFLISLFKKKCFLGYICILFSIIICIITTIYSKYFVLEYSSELVKIDQYSYFFIIMLLISGIYTCVFSYSWLEYSKFRAIEFYLFVLLSIIGGIVLSISLHFSTLFIGMELLFLPLLGILMFFPKSNKNLFSILVYMILSLFSSSSLLLGFSFIYFLSGKLSFSSFSYFFIYYPSIMLGSIMMFGIAMIFLSFFFKLSLFPLHTWLPGIYENTNSCALIYFSTATKISIFSCLIRILTDIPFLNRIQPLFFILNSVAILSILFGNIFSIFQSKTQKIIGYLSISNAGLMLLILLINISHPSKDVMEYFFIYLFSYILGLIGFFSIKSVSDYNVFCKKNFNSLDNSLTGLFWNDFILGFVMSVILLSFSGFPIILGFWGKFFILKYLIQKKLFFIVCIIMFSSMIGTQSYLTIVRNIYYRSVELKEKHVVHDFFVTKLQKFLIICIGLILIIFGVFPKQLMYILKNF